ARRLLRQVLIDSEPPPGSAAHERWQLAVVLQELALADLDHRDPTPVLQRLSKLAQGPIWEEVRRMARLPPAGGTRARQIAAAVGASRTSGKPAVAPEIIPAGVTERMPWSWPTFRELVPAALAALAVLAVTWTLGVLPVRALSHVTDAYQVDVVPAAPGAAVQLQ